MQRWPDPVSFDPQIGADAPASHAIIHGPAAALSAVMLIAGERALETGYAPDAAIALAHAWAASGRTPVLVDLQLDAPSLHERLGVPGDEGIADAFAFGTSTGRLSREVEGRGFHLLPAGYATDPEGLLTSNAWSTLIAQESAARRTLLLFVPATASGLAALSQHVGAAIVLSEPEEAERTASVYPRGYGVVSVFTAPQIPDPTIVDQTTEFGTEAASDTAEPRIGEPKAASETLEPPMAIPPLIVDDVTELERVGAVEGAHFEESTGVLDAHAVDAVDADAADADSVADPDAAFERVRVPREGEGREELMAELRARQRAALLAPPSDADGAHTPDAELPPEIERSGIPLTQGELEPLVAGPATPAGLRSLEGEQFRSSRVETPTGTLPGEPPAMAPGATVLLPERRRSVVPAVLVLVAAVILVGAFWMWSRAQQPAPPMVAHLPAAPPVDSLATVALPYVVAIEAHTQLQTAQERRRTLTASEGWSRFMVAPIVRDDVPYYHVFAGPLRDSATAVLVLDSLLAHRVKTGAAEADVRQVPLSFLIDRYPGESAAMARENDLSRMGIPSFTLPSSDSGRAEWRVYAGAYASPAEAEVMRALLKGAGVKDSLVTRTGRAYR